MQNAKVLKSNIVKFIKHQTNLIKKCDIRKFLLLICNAFKIAYLHLCNRNLNLKFMQNNQLIPNGKNGDPIIPKTDPPVNPDKNIPVKPDKDHDPTRLIPGVNEPEKIDPTRIDNPNR